MQKKKSIQIILIMAFFCLPSLCFSCEVTAPQWFRFFTSYEKGIESSYSESDNPATVSGCKADGKFLMIGITPDFMSKNFIRMGAYNGQIGDDHCHITNNTLQTPEDPYAESAAFYALKTSFIRSCVVTTVEDMHDPVIRFPRIQPGCTITRVTNNKVQFSGTYCFFQPSPVSEYQVTHEIKADCANRDFLKANSIRPMDVPATISYYMAGDASGNSTQLQAKKMIPARFSIDPGSDLFSVSEDVGDQLPRWPAIWAPEIRFGSLSFKKASNNMTQVDLSMLADNHCQEVCKDGICSSPCDYSSPVAMEVTLSQVKQDGSFDYLDSWMTGGTMLPRWQGIMSTASHYMDDQPLTVGSRYHMDLLFRDPYDDYYALMTTVDQFLINLTSLQGKQVGLEQIPVMDGLAPLRVLPPIQGLTGLQSGDPGDQNSSLVSMLTSLSQFLKALEWPPYFDKVCDKSLQSCLSPQTDFTYHFGIDFQVSGESDDGYQISAIDIIADTKTAGSYTEHQVIPPAVACGNQP